ncbi:MAG: CoA transferase [Chloroflexi bacterium]|nr:CoA transferase [Chloroflexota bacterium]
MVAPQEAPTAPIKALDGLKVVDLTTVVSGPYAASLLADLGADVIKIEPPGGDSARSYTSTEPRYLLDGMTPHILTLQRNKRSVVINLRHDAGRETFYDLVRWADVVLDNYRPGVTERLRVDYPALREVNPRIIACSITGYGLTGPARDRAALDACIQAYSGVMGITGEPDGEPLRAGPLYSDLCSGMAGALGILAALASRERTGAGQQVDISMLDVQLSMLNYTATMHLMSGLPAERMGNEHALHAPYNAYRTSDGWVFVAIVLNAHWPRLVDALGAASYPPALPELEGHLAYLRSERLNDRVQRLEERSRINEALGALLATGPREGWVALLTSAGVPAAPVNSVEEAVADPQVRSRGMIAEVPHPRGGTYRTPGNPIKLSGAGADSFTPPPELGADTRSVLRDVLGYDDSRIGALLGSETVAEAGS